MSNVIQFNPKFVSKVLARKYDLPVQEIAITYESLSSTGMLPQLHATLELKEWHSKLPSFRK